MPSKATSANDKSTVFGRKEKKSRRDMEKIIFLSFNIKRYRSLIDLTLNISDKLPVVICGENNIGKTNVLRALNIFFNHVFQPELFQADFDIPHHIYYGSGGAGCNTILTGCFLDRGKKKEITVKFDQRNIPTYLINKERQSNDALIKDFFSNFNFIFIESHNINLPELISIVLEKDGLLLLDNKRAKQSKPLETLRDFIRLSGEAIKDIEKDINSYFEKLKNFDGILKGKKIKIDFVEFDKLRDVVKTMTSITLNDGNNHGIASKGSGAQRAVFLSLIQHISRNSKKNIIWGIDEPEAFLQPRLQKKVSNVLQLIAKEKNQPIIITTHSQYFINLGNLEMTLLLEGKSSERKYTRKPGKIYYEINTKPVETSSNFKKATLIKEHLGISGNDGWQVVPHNLIVEGEEDKKYIEILFRRLNIPVPNIIWSGGASKIGGYLQFYNDFAKDLDYKPNFICIFDNDKEGREQKTRIKNFYKQIDVKAIFVPRYDGICDKVIDSEIEDFLPVDLVFKAVNFIFKKEQYKIVSKIQQTNRDKPAHKNKQILKYIEECCAQNNPDKELFNLDSQGRKMQICQKIEELFFTNPNNFHLSQQQIDFLQGLIEIKNT